METTMTLDELKPNMLLQSGREVYQVSTVGERSFTAQQLLPVPSRTTVRTFMAGSLVMFKEPTPTMVRKYERAWVLSPRK